MAAEWQNGHPTEDGFYLIDYGPNCLNTARFRMTVLENGKLWDYPRKQSVGGYKEYPLSLTTFQYIEIDAPDEV